MHEFVYYMVTVHDVHFCAACTFENLLQSAQNKKLQTRRFHNQIIEFEQSPNLGYNTRENKPQKRVLEKRSDNQKTTHLMKNNILKT